jgi:DGQHR domain-containing protein
MNYQRTKEEYAKLVADAIARHGKVLKLPIIRLRQRENIEMFSTPLRQDLSQLLLQRLPRDYNNPGGIQRAFKNEKIAEIRELAKNNNRYTAPGSIVATVTTKDRPWVQVEWNSDQLTGQLKVDLQAIQQKLEKLPGDDDGSLEEELFKIGYVIDAHHRTEGHYLAGKFDLEMATTIYLNLPKTEMAGVFSWVNEKQEKPSQTHTLAMKEMAGLLKDQEKAAVELARAMNENETSVLYDRIKTFDGRRPTGMSKTYVNLKPFTDQLKDFVLDSLPDSFTIANKEELLEQYYRAWQEVFPAAWNDPTKHVLVKAMGFSLINRLFTQIYSIAESKYQTDSPTQKQFTAVVEALKDAKLKIIAGDTEKTLDLDWKSESLGGFSSGKGINELYSQLKAHLLNKKADLLNFKKSA